MSLQSRITALANRVGAEFKAIRTALKLTGSGTTKTLHNVLDWSLDGSLPGKIIIHTPITFSSKMVNIKIEGYNHLTGQSIIDVNVSGYAYSAGTMLQYGATSNGTFRVGVTVARTSAGTLDIILDPTATQWSYPTIRVSQVIFGYTTADDAWVDGWSAEYVTEVPAYPYSLALPVRDLQLSHAEIGNKMDRYELGNSSATTPWFRICTVDGQQAQYGAAVTLMIAGAGTFGVRNREIHYVQCAQRANDTIETWIWTIDNSASEWIFYTKQISTYSFELWAQRPAYDLAQINVLSTGSPGEVTMHVDSSTTTEPTGLVAVPLSHYRTLIQSDDPRLTDARTPTAHSHTIANITSLQSNLNSLQSGVDSKLPAITAGVGNTKIFRDVLAWGESVSNGAGTLVIDTPITPTAMMCNIRIAGFNYVDSNNSIDLVVSFYAYTTGNPIAQGSVLNMSSDNQIGAVRLARKTSTGTISILIDTNRSGWYYPKITVPELIVGHTIAPDTWKNGWSCARVNDISGYGSIVTPGRRDLTETQRVVHGWRSGDLIDGSKVENNSLSIAKTSGLQSALDGKSGTGHTHSPASIGAAPTSHSHTIANITGLQDALDDIAPAPAPDIQVFDASGTWTKPAGATRIRLVMTGGGNAGSSPSWKAAASGAIDGVFPEWYFSETSTVTVGAGGAKPSGMGGTSSITNFAGHATVYVNYVAIGPWSEHSSTNNWAGTYSASGLPHSSKHHEIMGVGGFIHGQIAQSYFGASDGLAGNSAVATGGSRRRVPPVSNLPHGGDGADGDLTQGIFGQGGRGNSNLPAGNGGKYGAGGGIPGSTTSAAGAGGQGGVCFLPPFH